MKFIFHPDAEVEYAEAAAFYEDRLPGLGKDFTLEVESAAAQIGLAPNRWREVDEDVRRYLVHRFPYAILYTIEESYLLIVAVMHLSREPGYWRYRTTAYTDHQKECLKPAVQTAGMVIGRRRWPDLAQN